MDRELLTTPPAPPDPPPAGRRHQPGSGAVAVVLAAAAVAAAVVGTCASLVSNQASDAWQSAVRTEVKRSAAALNDISYLYQVEFPQAVQLLPAVLLSDSLRALAAGQSEAAAQALEDEAALQTQIADLLSAGTPLLEDPTYRLPSGGFDLGKRLADLRASGTEGPQFLALNPESLLAEGDRLAAKASALTYALIPISLCALLGVLAQPLQRWRGRLLLAALIALAAGSLLASLTGVMA